MVSPFSNRFRTVFDRFCGFESDESAGFAARLPFSRCQAPLKNGENGKNGRAASEA